MADWIQAIGTVVALFAAVWTINQQRIQLELQRTELTSQRRALLLQRDELKAQREELRLQRLELRFNNEVQTNIAKTARLDAYLDRQTELVRWSCDDPDLQVMGETSSPMVYKQFSYINLWFRLLSDGFSSGEKGTASTRTSLAQMFSSPLCCVFWENSRMIWKSEKDFDDFIKIVDDEFATAVATFSEDELEAIRASISSPTDLDQ